MARCSTKMKPTKRLSMGGDVETPEEDKGEMGDEEVELQYPGTSGIAAPIAGKQQVKGFKFKGVF